MARGIPLMFKIIAALLFHSPEEYSASAESLRRLVETLLIKTDNLILADLTEYFSNPIASQLKVTFSPFASLN
jgi:hypothetical protein